jgi:hypothetical protein
MKTPLINISLSLLLLLPFYTHAEGSLSAGQSGRDTSTKKEQRDVRDHTGITKTESKSSNKELRDESVDQVKEISQKNSTTTEEGDDVATSSAKLFTICSQEAIESRDTKIAASRLIYNNAMASALNDRKNKEKAAVAIKNESDKKTAIKVSVDAYKSLVKTAQNNLVSSRKAAWTEFEADIATCRTVQEKEDMVITSHNISSDEAQEPSLRKNEDNEVKTIKDTFKAKFESLKSLFN